MGLGKTIKMFRKLGLKEFSKRFKQGLIGITPLQSTRTQLMGMNFIFTGIVWGLVVTIMIKMYWLTLILIGSLTISAMQWVGLKQKYYRFKQIELNQKEILK